MSRLLGGGGNRVLCLTLGADEEDTAAIGYRVAHRLQRAMQHGHRLGEIYDVDVVAGSENVFRHLRIPAMGLMAEMDTSLQQLAHGEFGNSHFSFLRLSRRRPASPS